MVVGVVDGEASNERAHLRREEHTLEHPERGEGSMNVCVCAAQCTGENELSSWRRRLGRLSP